MTFRPLRGKSAEAIPPHPALKIRTAYGSKKVNPAWALSAGGETVEGPNRARVVDLETLRVYQLEPNFTAILPGKCQARCAFCIEPEGPDPPSSEAWLQSFETLVGELPPIFRILSISGGEPSLSPVFPQLLNWLRTRRGRFGRIVLTTNGCYPAVHKNLDALAEAVTHVNISRHAVGDADNARVFKTGHIPTTAELADLISKLNRRGLPVNFNCVYSSRHALGQNIEGWSRKRLRDEAKRFITFARSLGVSSLVFRHDHRDPHLDGGTAMENAFDDYRPVHEARCESCRVVGKLIRGMPVNFKRSAYEPIALHQPEELYELVFHSDGHLYRDWSRLHPIHRPLSLTVLSRDYHELQAGTKPRIGRPPVSVSAPDECQPGQSSCRIHSLISPP